MKKRCIKVTYPNGTHSYFESVKACADYLDLTKPTVHNYLNGKTKIMGIKFEYYSMTPEENLLREVTQFNAVIK